MPKMNNCAVEIYPASIKRKKKLHSKDINFVLIFKGVPLKEQNDV